MSWGDRAAEQYEKDQPSTIPAPADKPLTDEEAIDMLARQWRKRRTEGSSIRVYTPLGERIFVEDSYRWARDALAQIKAAGVELVPGPNYEEPDDAQ